MVGWLFDNALPSTIYRKSNINFQPPELNALC